jgi:hypothetical protein
MKAKFVNEGFWANTEEDDENSVSRGGYETEIGMVSFYDGVEDLLRLTDGKITDEVINGAIRLIIDNTPFINWLEVNKGKTVHGVFNDSSNKVDYFSY